MGGGGCLAKTAKGSAMGDTEGDAAPAEPIYDYNDGNDVDDDYASGFGVKTIAHPSDEQANTEEDHNNRLGRRLGPCVCCKCTNTPLWRKGRNCESLCLLSYHRSDPCQFRLKYAISF